MPKVVPGRGKAPLPNEASQVGQIATWAPVLGRTAEVKAIFEGSPPSSFTTQASAQTPFFEAPAAYCLVSALYPAVTVAGRLLCE